MLRSRETWTRSAATPTVDQRVDGEAHHDLGTADQRPGVVRIEAAAPDQLGHDADLAAPAAGGVVDGDIHLQVELAAPTLQFLAVQDVLGRPGAVHDADIAVGRTVGENLVDGRTQRREADADGHDDDVAALEVLDRPGRPIGAAHADDLPDAQLPHGVGHVADGARGVGQWSPAWPGPR